MSPKTYSPKDVEVLIATMNRRSLDFLHEIFRRVQEIPSVLIVNQTEKGRELHSHDPKIRVINSFDRGLTKSRNRALQNLQKEIGVIADDDVVFERDFVKKIIEAHNRHQKAGLISFQVKTFGGTPYKNYPLREKQIRKRRKETPLSSVEITFKRKIFRGEGVFFDECFGLGSQFQAGEEELLLMQLFKKHIPVWHIPDFILSHPDESSASQQGTDRFIYARGALKYLQYGNWAKLWLVKFVFFLLRHNFIKFNQVIQKYKVGLAAISKIKTQENEKH